MHGLGHYLNAYQSLGAAALVQRAADKLFGKGPTMKFTSKYVRQPMWGRRNSTDLAVFHQIFVEREYRCLDGLRGINTIIDAGANCGFSSAYLLSKFPGSRVVAIEPDPGNFSVLTRNLEPFGGRADCLQAALWSEPCDLQFDEATVSDGLEWGRRTEPVTAHGTTRISALDMPSVIERFGLETIDLLKIDIEGAEEAVFSATNLIWLERVKNIVIELHGERCSSAFFSAIMDRNFSVSSCGELTVCLTN